MTTITPNVVTPNTINTPATSNAASASALSSDFDTFLQMLTAQARYQDPLEPIDNAEYAAQLAQFSMVEQQVSTNELMEQVLAALATDNMAGAVNWIGKEALVQGPVRFEGDPVTISPNPPLAADDVNLVVRNASGTVVQTVPLPVSADPIEWTGGDPSGTPLPYGEYTLEIESRANGEILLTEPAFSYTRITEARIQDGETLLALDSGYLVRASSIAAIREPI